MRVIYKPYMVKFLRKEIRKADELGLEIEKFILTETEHEQLKSEMPSPLHLHRPSPGVYVQTFDGIPVEVK